MNILQIDSSILGVNSVSRALTAQVVAQLKHTYPEADFIYRDVNNAPISHLSSEILTSRFIPQGEWTTPQKEEALLTETLLAEVFKADIFVIGAPMYNFSVPTQLKSWFDRILVAGRTFRYTEQGPVGLLENKKAIVVSSRGGFYSTTEIGRMADFQEAYIKTILHFIGITEVAIVRAEGINVSPQDKENALNAAALTIGQLAT